MSPPPPSDVTCRCIMAADYPVLTPGMTLAECVSRLLQNRVLAMPVVDETGRYLGQFRKHQLISAVLPQISVHDPSFDGMERMIDAGLLSDTMADVRERFSNIANEPVGRHLDTEAPALRPEQPLTAAMFLLFHGRNFVPVVEPATGILVGVISTWDVLENIIKKS